MKPSHPHSALYHARRPLLVAALTVLFGVSTAVAQSTSATGSKTPGITYETSDKSQSGQTASTKPNQGQPTSATGSGYHSGTAAADVDATKEINAASGAGEPTGRVTQKLAWGDRRFVTKAADAGMDEVQIAKLAAEKASNAEVRSVAQKFADEHSTMNSELTTLAGQKNVKIDQEDDKDRAYKRLSKKTGADFDQEFVEHMIDEHEKHIRMFEKAAKDAKDEDVRAFASKHVDHLREHLTTAEGLRQTVTPTGRMDTSSGRSTPGGTQSGDNPASSTAGSSTSSPSSDPSSTPKP